jgi:hypothetical protein
MEFSISKVLIGIIDDTDEDVDESVEEMKVMAEKKMMVSDAIMEDYNEPLPVAGIVHVGCTDPAYRPSHYFIILVPPPNTLAV